MKLTQAILLFVAFLSTGCVSMDAHRERHPDPNARLDQMLALYDHAKRNAESCREIWRADYATVDCERVANEIERLYVEFPENDRILMAHAVVNFDARRFQNAEFLLDHLLSRPGTYPEASILRSRISLQNGNTASARNVLSRAIMLSPERSDLREAIAAVDFFSGNYDDAKQHLRAAGRLGTPGWRISYHLGLIEEYSKQWTSACRLYSLALDQKPDHRQTVARIAGLGDHIECFP